MHQLAEIVSYPGNPPTYASIMVFDGMFLSVSNRFWFCSAQEMVTVISRPPGPRAFGLASACTSWAPAALPIPWAATAVGLAFAAASMGWGAITREGRVA